MESGVVTHSVEAEPKGELTHSLSNWPERELATSLHPQVLSLLMGAYGAMLLTLWVFFGTDISTVIALAVCTMYFAMYFGVPIVMLRIAGEGQPAPEPASLSRFLKGDVDINTGPVSGQGAVVQLMTIPVGLTGAFIAIGIIIRLGT